MVVVLIFIRSWTEALEDHLRAKIAYQKCGLNRL
jgi:hypothetical protein